MNFSRYAIKLTALAALLMSTPLTDLLFDAPSAFAQVRQPESLPSEALTEILNRRGSVTLRDTSITDAMFVLRKQWQVDMVVSANIDGTVNAAFTNASLREILDSLLLSRGFGYRVEIGRAHV